MAKFILGRKLGMSQIFKDDGKMIPVTLIEAGPITVTKVRTQEKDGYSAIQVGFEESKGKAKFKNLKEFRVDDESAFKEGDIIDVSAFNEADTIKVTGISKGKGFAGVMKRHNFKGMPASHGHKHVKRHAGSIGQRFPQHTLKGMRMAGHMGAERVTTRGLKVVDVKKDENILFVKGAVPGPAGSLLEITTL